MYVHTLAIMLAIHITYIRKKLATYVIYVTEHEKIGIKFDIAIFQDLKVINLAMCKSTTLAAIFTT